MPIQPPKITGDPVVDSWSKDVSDNLNELEVQLNTQLEVNDVQSANWNGASSVPSNITNESDFANLAAREAVIGTEGFFLDASSGIITTEDILIRGDIASANFQVTGGNAGWFLDGETGRGFMNTTINRGDVVSPAVANRHGGTAFTTINDAQVGSLPSAAVEGWAVNSGGTAYFDTLYTRNLQASNLSPSGNTFTKVFEAPDGNNATYFQFHAPLAFHDNTNITSTSTFDSDEVTAGATYTALITWNTTSNQRSSSTYTSNNMTAATVTFTLPPGNTDFDGSAVTSGFGIGSYLLSLGVVHYLGLPLCELFTQYDSGNSNTPDIFRCLETNQTNSSTVTDGTVGVRYLWKHG